MSGCCRSPAAGPGGHRRPRPQPRSWRRPWPVRHRAVRGPAGATGARGGGDGAAAGVGGAALAGAASRAAGGPCAPRPALRAATVRRRWPPWGPLRVAGAVAATGRRASRGAGIAAAAVARAAAGVAGASAAGVADGETPAGVTGTAAARGLVDSASASVGGLVGVDAGRAVLAAVASRVARRCSIRPAPQRDACGLLSRRRRRRRRRSAGGRSRCDRRTLERRGRLRGRACGRGSRSAGGRGDAALRGRRVARTRWCLESRLRHRSRPRLRRRGAPLRALARWPRDRFELQHRHGGHGIGLCRGFRSPIGVADGAAGRGRFGGHGGGECRRSTGGRRRCRRRRFAALRPFGFQSEQLRRDVAERQLQIRARPRPARRRGRAAAGAAVEAAGCTPFRGLSSRGFAEAATIEIIRKSSSVASSDEAFG